MSCDLCKRPYPYKFSLKGATKELIQIPKPPEKYVILEGLCKDKNSSKWLHVINLNSKDIIKFGRANDCELRMSDISVSRHHGTIKLVGENFFLEDKSSKFGTLIQIKRPVALDSASEMEFQCGRTLLVIGVKRPWSLIPACFKTSSSPFDLFSAPYPNGVLPLLPINTGIPLSIDDSEELMIKAGVLSKKKNKHNDNLMFEHGQLGMNSSLEDDEIDGIVAIEEVKIANMDDEHKVDDIIDVKEINDIKDMNEIKNINDINELKLNQTRSNKNEEKDEISDDEPYESKEKRSHSFV